MTLYPHQQQLVNDVRQAMRKHDRVFMQLATGGGKTVIVSSMTRTAYERKFIVWFVVPRNELLEQASNHFTRHGIPHNFIKAGRSESKAYPIHIVSKDTLMRRLKKNEIKAWPQFCIFDEAHVAIDQQKAIMDAAPDNTKFLGISATPERTDGRGLSDIYGTIVYGPDMRWMVERGYLSPFQYYAPPIEGIEDLHRKGTEYDANELDELLKKRAVYGKAIEHYRSIAHKQPCIVFCRNIKAAEDTAARFREAGYNFESIDGRMSNAKRKAIIDGVRDGRLDGITSVDLCIYGLDVPRLKVAIMLRPTTSKAVFFQQIGRVLRVEDGKDGAIILDHVGNIREHGHPLQDTQWQFYGREKRGKRKGISADILRLCPNCFLHYQGSTCPNCGAGRDGHGGKAAQFIEVDGRLIERKGPVPLKERPYDERREFHAAVAKAVESWNADASPVRDYAPVEQLVKMAEDAGYSIMWVYHQLNNLNHAVNVPVLEAIAHVKGYKHYWVVRKREEMQKRIGRRAEESLL